MKVYVVTDGCYSDYKIVRIYLDKSKARKYKELTGIDNDILEIETSDDVMDAEKPMWEVTSEYKPVSDKMILNITKCCAFSADMHSSVYLSCGVVYIRDLIPRGDNDSQKKIYNQVYNKNLKASRDYYGIIKEQLLNGVKEKEINEMLSQRIQGER